MINQSPLKKSGIKKMWEIDLKCKKCKKKFLFYVDGTAMINDKEIWCLGCFKANDQLWHLKQ